MVFCDLEKTNNFRIDLQLNQKQRERKPTTVARDKNIFSQNTYRKIH